MTDKSIVKSTVFLLLFILVSCLGEPSVTSGDGSGGVGVDAGELTNNGPELENLQDSHTFNGSDSSNPNLFGDGNVIAAANLTSPPKYTVTTENYTTTDSVKIKLEFNQIPTYLNILTVNINGTNHSPNVITNNNDITIDIPLTDPVLVQYLAFKFSVQFHGGSLRKMTLSNSQSKVFYTGENLDDDRANIGGSTELAFIINNSPCTLPLVKGRNGGCIQNRILCTDSQPIDHTQKKCITVRDDGAEVRCFHAVSQSACESERLKICEKNPGHIQYNNQGFWMKYHTTSPLGSLVQCPKVN